MGYIELGNGRFYDKHKLNKDYLSDVGLQILRGYKMTVTSLKNNRLCLQVDPCSRILQSDNLLEVIRSMGKSAMRKLKNATVVARYGNYKSYKVEKIDYNKTPENYFEINQHRKGKKPNEGNLKYKNTFTQYFKRAYGMEVQDKNQPLIRIIANTVKRIFNGKIEEK